MRRRGDEANKPRKRYTRCMHSIISAVARPIMRPIIFLYNKTHWFTDAEAWAVYRFFAIMESCGWTMLILAIIYRRLGLPEAPSVVSFAGHIHGVIFLLYFIIVLVTVRSMEWKWLRTGLALVAGMPPYGSLVFELLLARDRRKNPPQVTPPKEPVD